MKVLHLSVSDTGGAGRAVYRTHRGLLRKKVDSRILVRSKTTNDSAVITSEGKKISQLNNLFKLSSRIDSLPLRRYPNRKYPFSTQWLPDNLLLKVKQIDPDIINLHWVSAAYLKIETLPKLNRPLVWTLHDMWPFTGGCFYTYECDRYRQSCGACPNLQSNHEQDLSRRVWQRKAQAWKTTEFTVIASSTWLAKCAESSYLFRNRPIKIIPCGLDTAIYKPLDCAEARRALNLPQDKHLILFGGIRSTQDKRKGFHLLQAALTHLSDNGWRDLTEVVIFGSSEPAEPIDLGFKAHYLGHIQDDVALALAYSAASLMVVPSIQEAFGQTASEALACGTPVVAFDGTGVADIVDHKKNGYLAQAFDVTDLANGITWILEHNERYLKLCDEARNKAEQEFSLSKQAERYLEIYRELWKK